MYENLNSNISSSRSVIANSTPTPTNILVQKDDLLVKLFSAKITIWSKMIQ